MTLRSLLSLPVISMIVVGVLLTGCNEPLGIAGAPPGKVGKTASTAVSMAAMAAHAKGFVVGSQTSGRPVYVFFDAQCPHCGALWNSAKPLNARAKFVWVPVGIINASSTAQGATLLASSDPVAAMEEHEISLLAKQGGIGAVSSADTQKASIAKNTELMTAFGFTSIPTIVGTHAQTGALVTHEGALTTEALADLLGLQISAN